MNYKIVVSSLLSLSVMACSQLPQPFQTPLLSETIDRFQVKNEVAVDSRSGLMWSRCLLGMTWTGTTCVGTPTVYSWQQVNNMVKTLTYAGYSDWRVPTLDELKLLARTDVSSPMTKIPFLNPTVVPMPKCLEMAGGISSDSHLCWHWTSTPIEGSDHYAWIVYFGYGYDNANYDTASFPVRLVRNNR